MAIVLIYSIPRATATGVSEFTSDISGKKLNKTKIGKCTDTIMCANSSKLGGLTNYISYTPWIENGVVKELNGIKLTLQEKYEEQFKLPKGYLTNKAYNKDDKQTTYFQTKTLKLNDGCTVLDTSRFEDLMSYYICLGSPLVANSEKEWRQYKWPKALYYIAQENEAEEIKYQKNMLRAKAFGFLGSKELTSSWKFKIAAILNITTCRVNDKSLTDEFVNNLLYEYIDKSSFTPNSNIDKLNNLASLLSTAEGKKELEAMFLLKQALDFRLIYEKQGGYYWTRQNGTIELGATYTEALAFISSPSKAVLVEELMKEIKLKT